MIKQLVTNTKLMVPPVIDRSIPVIPPNGVLERQVNGPVDFLKVDAQGHEESV